MRRNLTTAAPLLGKLVKGTALFILLLMIVSAVLYGTVLYRHNALPAFLRAQFVFAVLLGVVSVYGIVLDLWYSLKYQKPAYFVGILGYILLLIFGGLAAMAAAFILSAAGGNR
jgi:hypothetical protein